MSVEEVRWMSYSLQEIRDCWVSTWHGFITYLYVVESYMPDRAHKPANNRMYVVRNLFVGALWLEAPSHLLTETWTSVLDPPMPDKAQLDLIAREARREDARKEENFDRIADLLSRHYRDT
ncbi:hypothetical protein M9H77_11774 [Catharanthus roseus]|uniref:Uncharacterized protein n=1 Tax=Catharanthus roseus TaxID=4058 RepID=A0ACC0BFJ9_CATRO|nr:hypothetical protein M9H77_11774 [Catharanthus roseus]